MNGEASPELLHAAREWIWRHSSQPNGDRWLSPRPNLIQGDDPNHLDWAAQNLLVDLAPWLVARGVTPAEIDRQSHLGWPDFHPEDFCHRCGQRNVYSWHAPNEVWNTVVPDEWRTVICPQCFTEFARAAGIEPTVWKLVDGDTDRPCGDAL